MKNIILDCDPGHDDAIAILLAGQKKFFNLLGITTISGNQTIEKTTRNALNLVNFFQLDVPVAMGCSEPLVREKQICEAIHGKTGLDGYEFEPHNKVAEDIHAYELIIKLTSQNEHVTIVATGPITNVALALKAKPEIKKHIDEIIFMGGSIDNGNVSPAAEFNVLCDPEATHIVLESGVPTKMVGLNVTRKVLCSKEVVIRMAAIQNRTSDLFVKLMEVFNANQAKTFSNFVGGPLHDPVTIASLIDDKLVTYKYLNVSIDLTHGPSYGRTNVDVYDYLKLPHNCDVAVDINVKRFWDILEEGIRSYK